MYRGNEAVDKYEKKKTVYYVEMFQYEVGSRGYVFNLLCLMRLFCLGCLHRDG